MFAFRNVMQFLVRTIVSIDASGFLQWIVGFFREQMFQWTWQPLKWPTPWSELGSWLWCTIWLGGAHKQTFLLSDREEQRKMSLLFMSFCNGYYLINKNCPFAVVVVVVVFRPLFYSVYHSIQGTHYISAFLKGPPAVFYTFRYFHKVIFMSNIRIGVNRLHRCTVL